MHSNRIVVVFVRGINRGRCGGFVDHWVDVLVSLPQEDRVCEASSSFGIYAGGIADHHAQMRFQDHHLYGLQCQFGFADEVNSLSTLINDPKTNLSSILGVATIISVRNRLNLLSL
jgi:hypothetical protein